MNPTEAGALAGMATTAACLVVVIVASSGVELSWWWVIPVCVVAGSLTSALLTRFLLR